MKTILNHTNKYGQLPRKTPYNPTVTTYVADPETLRQLQNNPRVTLIISDPGQCYYGKYYWTDEVDTVKEYFKNESRNNPEITYQLAHAYNHFNQVVWTQYKNGQITEIRSAIYYSIHAPFELQYGEEMYFKNNGALLNIFINSVLSIYERVDGYCADLCAAYNAHEINVKIKRQVKDTEFKGELDDSHYIIVEFIKQCDRIEIKSIKICTLEKYPF